MKILHIGNFNIFGNGDRFYATERKITNGFIKNNHTVFDFPLRNIAKYNNIFQTKKLGVKKMNMQLEDIVLNFMPDVVVIGNVELIYLETLKKMKDINPNLKIILWFVDPIYDEYRIRFILKIQEILDAVFVTTNPMFEKRFIQEKFYYLPNIVDNSIDIHQNFEKTVFDFDFIYCGSSRTSQSREDFLISIDSSLKNLDLKFCGNMGNKNIFGNDYMNLLGNTKMALNYSKRNDVSMYSSDRVAQLTGNGILTFCPRVPDFEKVYTEEELVYFDDVNDLIEKVKYYNENDLERKYIAKNGYNRSHNEYNSTVITKWMLEKVLN